MSLAGSLDEFALADIMSLLAATSSRGVLHLDAPAYSVELAVQGDCLLDIPGTSLVDVLDRLLSTTGVRFRFEPDSHHRDGQLMPSAPAVEEAMQRRAARAEMASIVPSGAWMLSLAAVPVAQPLVIDHDGWAVVRAVGDGRDMDAVVARHGADPLSVYRTVKRLIDSGVVRVAPPAGQDWPAVEQPDALGGSAADESAVVAGELAPAPQDLWGPTATPFDHAVPDAVTAGVWDTASGEVPEPSRVTHHSRSLFGAFVSETWPAPEILPGSDADAGLRFPEATAPAAPAVAAPATPVAVGVADAEPALADPEPALADRGPWPAAELASLLAQARNEESGWRNERPRHADAVSDPPVAERTRPPERAARKRFFSSAKA